MLPASPAGPAGLRFQDRPPQLAPGHTTTGHVPQSLPCPRRPCTLVWASPETDAVSTTTARPEAGFRLHPDALARREKAEKRQQERNHIVSLRQQMKSEGRSWWQTLDTSNCFTVMTTADYERHLTSAKDQLRLVVCLFFAPWCLACRALHPKVEQIAEQNPDVLFIKANVEQMQEIASSLQIQSMPWFVFYKGAGDPVTRFTASLQPNRLAKLRAEIALHKA